MIQMTNQNLITKRTALVFERLSQRVSASAVLFVIKDHN